MFVIRDMLQFTPVINTTFVMIMTTVIKYKHLINWCVITCVLC